MPSISVYPPAQLRATDSNNPLPQLLHTPSGLALVEIQGTVNAPADDHASSTQVGKFVFPSNSDGDDTAWQKNIYLYVGKHQRMTGEVKKLPKPLALLRRKMPSETSSSSSEDLEIAEIVYYKILFAHRPEPVGGVDSPS